MLILRLALFFTLLVDRSDALDERGSEDKTVGIVKKEEEEEEEDPLVVVVLLLLSFLSW